MPLRSAPCGGARPARRHRWHCPPATMSTDQVAPRERAALLGATGSTACSTACSPTCTATPTSTAAWPAARAGDVVLTRLEANRHRVMRSASQVRGSEVGYLKIVAPFVGCAGVEQKGREAWVTPGQWSIYDTTDSYAVANPVRVEHLIVMLPKDRPRRARAGARRADGAPPRAAAAASRAWRWRPCAAPTASCPACATTPRAASATRSRSSCTCRCSTWPGSGTAVTQREALRERIKQHVMRAPGRPGALGRQHRACAQLQPPPALQRLRRRARRRGRLHPAAPARGLPRRLRRPRHGRALDHRHRAGFGFSNMAHFSRVFRAHTGLSPSEYRRERTAQRVTAAMCATAEPASSRP